MLLSLWRKLVGKRMNQAARRGQEKRKAAAPRARLHVEQLEERTVMSGTPVRPLLVLPGIGGTFPNDPGLAADWYHQRSFAPEQLALDPLGGSYNDLMQTLQNSGYTPGKDLFGATYDWRMDVAPKDNVIDGNITGPTAASITHKARRMLPSTI